MTIEERQKYRRELVKLIATALASDCFGSAHGTSVIVNAVLIADEITLELTALEKKEMETGK